MVISLALKKEYIPEWNGNREVQDKIVVLHRVPTMSLYDTLIPKPKVVMKVGKNGAEGGETEISIDTSAIVKGMLVEIKGLSFDIEGRTVTIKDATDLYGPDAPAMLAGLTDELGRYFQEILTNRNLDTKN